MRFGTGPNVLYVDAFRQSTLDLRLQSNAEGTFVEHNPGISVSGLVVAPTNHPHLFPLLSQQLACTMQILQRAVRHDVTL